MPGALAAADAAPAYSPAGSVLQVVFGLAVVLAVMWGAAHLLRRHGALRQGAGALRVVGGVAVGQRERVVMVEVGDQWLVLGVAPGRVNALHVMARGELPAGPATAPEKPSRFAADLLKRLQGKS